MKRIFILSLLGLATIAQAQEVRRALPANAPSVENYQNPSWVDRLPDGQPVEVRRAESVKPATPAVPPPVVEPTPVPPTPQPTPSATVFDDPQNIRIAPGGGSGSPAEALLLGRKGPLLSYVPVGGFQLVVVQCRAMQVGCQ